jgi:hypothetical protein
VDSIADQGHASRYDAAIDLNGGDDEVHDHRGY